MYTNLVIFVIYKKIVNLPKDPIYGSYIKQAKKKSCKYA